MCEHLGDMPNRNILSILMECNVQPNAMHWYTVPTLTIPSAHTPTIESFCVSAFWLFFLLPWKNTILQPITCCIQKNFLYIPKILTPRVFAGLRRNVQARLVRFSRVFSRMSKSRLSVVANFSEFKRCFRPNCIIWCTVSPYVSWYTAFCLYCTFVSLNLNAQWNCTFMNSISVRPGQPFDCGVITQRGGEGYSSTQYCPISWREAKIHPYIPR